MQMDAKDWINIGAIIISPILAVQIQKWLETHREDKSRKYNLFLTLMMTRTHRLHPNHVFSLNQIDIEFSSYVNILGFRTLTKKYKKIIDAWKIYHDHLNNYSEASEWGTKRDDLLIDLLYEMSQSLGYDFDRVFLKRGSYLPQGWQDSDEMDASIKEGLFELMQGKKTLPVMMKRDVEDNPL